MRFEGLSHYITGILTPLSALQTREGIGIGEFADLPLLADWCASLNLDLIQLLPVNDTGTQSSPYNALSAFALHPIYLRITDLPEFHDLGGSDRAAVEKAIEELRDEHAGEKRVRYESMLAGKLHLLQMVFSVTRWTPALEAAAERYMSSNPWVMPYAAFKLLKKENDQKPWKEWREYRDPTASDMEAIWADASHRETLHFHVWLQMRLEEQFRQAAEAVRERGIMLKGDLPIMMNEDSVDVWAQRDAFITRLRAGAPPDMFSHLGQYWDFPIYDWDHLAETGYRWWKDRLAQADKFYTAYRIDHVLGFFRVWAIPAANWSGLLGHFYPAATAARERLYEAGFDDGRIKWLSEPHLSGEEIRNAAKEQEQAVIDAALSRIGDEDLFLFHDAIRGERDIDALPLPEELREWVMERYRDRALIRLEHDRFAPAWSFRNCTRYTGLPDHEKAAFEELVAELGDESERLWEEQGRRLLGFMRESSEMLPCAEDLGVIPNCVPRVLSDLGMLGLRIPRWARLWEQPGQPYIPPREYPFWTVCAPSVHDTSTLRGWWQENDDTQLFWKGLGLPGTPPRAYDAGTARIVTDALLQTSSSICVFQVQDILALSDETAIDDAADERVNVPGTVNDTNWNYRIPFALEELLGREDITNAFGPMVKQRRARAVKQL